MRTRPASLALVVLAACSDGGGGGEADTGAATGGPTGTDDPTAATSGGGPTSAPGPTTPPDPSNPTTDPTVPDPSGSSTADPSATDTGDPSTGDPSTTTSTTGDGEACVDDHRVVAFLTNWQACPSPAQMANWSHAVVAFAVSYTWTPNGNVCDETCALGAVPGCNGKTLAELAADLHAAGVKVLLSFGGAGMGGVWEGTCGQMTKCWDHCLGRTDSLVDALAGLVADNDLDGVDIDYEYCLHDAAHRGFLGDLTSGLRVALDALPGGPKLLTHAPMDSELHAGEPYFDLVAEHAGELDFLMPQYYNGGMSPFEANGLAAIEDHYRALVDGPFGGDASRVVFGYCIEPGCNPVATQPAAVDVAQTVAGWYPNDGGAFFWAHPNETDGWFAGPLRTYYDENFCGG
jgi:chitinase